jgi:hypothetical protein
VRRALIGLALSGCPTTQPGSEPTPPPPELPDAWTLTAAPSCVAPIPPGLGRFNEEAADRGLTEPVGVEMYGRWTLIAEDLDRDGDIDIAYATSGGAVSVFHNDGLGHFTPGTPATVTNPLSLGTLVAADVVGDNFIDLLIPDTAQLGVAPGSAEGFGPTEMLHIDDTDPPVSVGAMSAGDADGDGDLDLAVLGHTAFDPDQPPPEPGDPPANPVGTRDLLLLLQDGEVVSSHALMSAGGGTLVLAGTFTDRDGDSDQDLLITSDLRLPTAFWRNDGNGGDGAPILVDDAEGIGAALQIDGMGIDSYDFNLDGELDYCITDSAPPKCLVSSPGGYVESGVALGLTVRDPFEPIQTIGWGIELMDFDHDGAVDAVQGSTPLPDSNNQAFPDLLWAGQPGGGFVDVTAETGFDADPNHDGLVTADFDGDGWLDILRAGPGRPPLLHMNHCGDGAFLSVEFEGHDGNPDAIGLRAELTAGGVTQIRELYAARGVVQRPSNLHFGLGAATIIEKLLISWPSGMTEEARNLPVRSVVVARQP